MVNYSIDTKIRRYVVCFLALGSVVCGYILNVYVTTKLSPPSIMAIFGVLFWLFDNYIWRVPYLDRILGVPDLNGNWHGTLSREDVRENIKEENVEVYMSINQTWSRINLVLENPNSESLSNKTRSFTRAASLSIQDPKAIILRDIFEYRDAQGMSELQLKGQKGSLSLDGFYCSTAMRIGNLTLVKQ